MTRPEVHNTVSGQVSGPVIQAGSITFNAASVPLAAAVRDPRPVFASVLAGGFTGREWVIRQIDDALASRSSGYVWVEADAGMGKTALAAHLARQRGWISHFARYANGGSVRVGLQNLAGQLISRYELWDLAPGRMLADWAYTPEGFETILAHAASCGPVVLLVDGADEASTVDGMQPWGLPNLLPPGVFVVGTYRTGSPPPRSETPRTVIRISPGDPRNHQDVHAHLRKTVPDETRAAEVAARCGGVWVYIRYVLDELTLGIRTDLTDLPADLRAYYLAQFARWRDDPQWTSILRLVATLAALREPAPIGLVAALSNVDEEFTGTWCQRRLRPFLTATTTTPRRFEIYHASLREALTALDPDGEEEWSWAETLRPAVKAAHSRIADHYLTRTEDQYGLRNLVHHLWQAGRADDLHALLGDGLTWFAAHDQNDTLDQYLADLALARSDYEHQTGQAIQAGRVAPTLVRELHYHLMAASISSLTTNVSNDLLAAAVTTGVWTPRRALSHARRTGQASALQALIPVLPPDQREDLKAEAVEAAWADPDERARLWNLACLAEHLAADQRAHVLAEVENAGGEFWADVVSRLAPHLTAAELDRALDADLRPPGDRAPGLVLPALTPRLSAAQLDRAFATAITFEDRDIALILAPYLSSKQLDRLLTAVTGIPQEHDRVTALTDLIPVLDDEQRTRALATTLSIVDGNADERNWYHYQLPLLPYLPADRIGRMWTVAQTLDVREALAMVPYLPENQLSDVVGQLLEALRDSSDDVQAELLQSVVPGLAADAHFQRVLEIAVATTNAGRNSELFKSLVPYLSDELIAEALAGVTATPGRASYWGLTMLAPYLNADQLQQAFAFARTVQDKFHREEALAGLAPYLPAGQQLEAIAGALAVAAQISDPAQRIEPIAALVPYLPAGRQALVTREILVAAADVPDHSSVERIAVLLKLGGQLTGDLLTEALALGRNWLPELVATVAPHLGRGDISAAFAVTLQAEYEWTRALLLEVLAPYLSPVDLDRAVAAAYALTEDSPRARAFQGLVPYLPEARRHDAIDAVLAVVGTLPTSEWPVVLRDLAPYMDRDQTGRLGEALLYDEPRAWLLGALADGLPDDQRADVLAKAWIAAGRTGRYKNSEEQLNWLAPKLVPVQYEQILSLTEAMEDDGSRSCALAALASRLPAGLAVRAFQIAREIPSGLDRTHAIVHVAPCVPADQRAEGMAEALAAVLAVPDTTNHISLLPKLAPHLSDEDFRTAVAAVLGGSGSMMSTVLTELVPIAADRDPELFVALFRAAFGRGERIACFEALYSCLPSLARYAGPDMGVELKATIEAVHRWWP